jgi:short-subunit dehydrogenase
MVDGLAVYGASKAGLNFFNQAVAQELNGSQVILGTINPGMVATDMILKQYEGRPEAWKAVRPIFNIIAERPEKVAPWMAECILTNTKNGQNFSYNSAWKLGLRFLTAPFTKRNIFRDIDEP